MKDRGAADKSMHAKTPDSVCRKGKPPRERMCVCVFAARAGGEYPSDCHGCGALSKTVKSIFAAIDFTTG